MERKKNGFTLVELLAVIVVLAIIMVIAIPAVITSMNAATKKSFALYCTKVLTAAETAYIEDTSLKGLTVGNPAYYNINQLGMASTGNYSGYVEVTIDSNNDIVTKIAITDGKFYWISDKTVADKLLPNDDGSDLSTTAVDLDNAEKACKAINGDAATQCTASLADVVRTA